jgi:hypothetical protein
MRAAGVGLAWALVPVTLWLGPAAASAQVFESLGTRALGMGGAFVAVADDATAVYWNPAGLATGPFFSMVLEWQEVGAPLGNDHPGSSAVEGSSAFIGLTSLPVGLVYYRQRSDTAGWQELRPAEGGDRALPEITAGPLLASLVTHHAGLALVQTIVQGVVVGSVVKLVRGSAGADPGLTRAGIEEVERRTSTQADLDVGVMAGSHRVRVGLVARNLREPGFDTPQGTRLTLERQVRAGAAWMVANRVTVALDADLTRTATPLGDRRHVAAGAEAWWWNRRFATRVGVRRSTTGEGDPVGTAGVSVGAATWLWIEGQMTRGGSAPDRAWGVGLRAGF